MAHWWAVLTLWQSRLGSVQNPSGGMPLPRRAPCLIPIILLLDGCGSGNLNVKELKKHSTTPWSAGILPAFGGRDTRAPRVFHHLG